MLKKTPRVLSIVKYVIRIFVLHVSIAKPFWESGKLQLTTDMTELEFMLGAFCGPSSKHGLEVAGEEYKMLRAIRFFSIPHINSTDARSLTYDRSLLFLDTASLASPMHAANLPPPVVLHHILVWSPLLLPHITHGWQEAEYVQRVKEHRKEDVRGLVLAALVGKVASRNKGGL
jgi:hypothetical protein